MTPTWTDQAPIYQQLADRLAVQLLDGSPPEGEALPSVRVLASQYALRGESGAWRVYERRK